MWLYIVAGVLIVVVAVVAYIFYRGYSKVKPEPVKGIPCPPLTHPILGHPDKMVHPLKHELRLEVTNSARAPIHQLVLMKHASFFINDAAEAARLISEIDTKGKIYNAFRYNATVPDMLASDGEEYMVRRGALRSALEFLNTKLAKENVAESLIQKLLSCAAKNEEVDFAKLSSFFSFDCVCTAAFGYSLNALDGSEDGLRLYNCLQTMAEVQSSQGLYAKPGARKVPAPELAAVKADWKEFLEKIVQHVRKEADDYMEKHQTLDTERNFAHAMVQLSKDRDDFDDAAMLNEVHQLLRHGQENLAAMLQWMVYAVFRTKKLRTKLEKAVLEHKPSKEQPFPVLLDCVVLETLRRYPSAGNMTVRTLPDGSDGEMISGRFEVPAGQSMHIPIFSLQNSAKLWYRPKEFLPERWTEAEAPSDDNAAQQTPTGSSTAPYCPKCPFSALAASKSNSGDKIGDDWQTLSEIKRVEPSDDSFFDGVGFTENSLAFFPFSAGARSCPAKLFAVQVLRKFLLELISNVRLDPVEDPGDNMDLGESVNAVILPIDKRSTKLTAARVVSLQGLVDGVEGSLEGGNKTKATDDGWADEEEEEDQES